MDLLGAHRQALSEFGRVLRLVGPEQWTGPTPCARWTVRELVNHLVNEQCWAPAMLRGATIAEIGDAFDGDLLGPDPVAAWDTASAAAWSAWSLPGALDGVVHGSAGDLPAPTYGWEMTMDVAVHAWDLATAIGVPAELGPELPAALLAETGPSMAQWRASGLLDPPVPVPATAAPVERLVARLGRRPH